MNISPDLRPQKTIPGSSTTHSETCRKKKERKKYLSKQGFVDYVIITEYM